MKKHDMQDHILPKDGKLEYSESAYWKDNTVQYSEEGECCAYKRGEGKDVGGFLKRNNFGDRL